LEIKNIKEAKDVIELDMHFSKTLDQLPQAELEDRGIISEEEAEKVDRIMEFFRRHSKVTCKAEIRTERKK